MAIRWERSPSNGGSAIVGYLIEHRRLGSPHWIRSTSGLCAFPELTLSGLEPGWRYQFRVRAQNALGLSQPSEVSEPLTVTLQRAAVACAPHFNPELKDTVALENEQVRNGYCNHIKLNTFVFLQYRLNLSYNSLVHHCQKSHGSRTVSRSLVVDAPELLRIMERVFS